MCAKARSLPVRGSLDFDELERGIAALPPKQRQIGDALLESPEVFAFGTLASLEKLLGVSRITVIRFAKRMGFDGYGPLQDAVRGAYLRHVGFQLPRADEPSEGDDLVTQTHDQHLANIEMMRANLDREKLERICALLVRARRILVCGSGTAEVVAALLVRLLRHVGLNGTLVNPAGVDGVIAMHDANERDVVVGISLWLTFRDTADVLELARRGGSSTVAIAGSLASPLRSLADEFVLAPAQGRVPRFSVVAAVAVIESLVAALADGRRDVVEQTQERLYDLYVEEGLIAPAARGTVTPKRNRDQSHR